MRINTNISSLNAWRNLSMTDGAMSKNLERLSSGYRINRAADDVAGLAISENMRAQITGLNQAVKNAQDGTSLLQTAEGSLNEVHTMLQRMRELAVQSANGTLQPEDRKQIQTEMDNLTKEVTRITNATQFNSKDLLDGSLQDTAIQSVTLQIGPNGGQTVNFSIGAMDAKSLGISRDVLTGMVDNGEQRAAVLGAAGPNGAIASAISGVGSGVSVTGATTNVQYRLNFASAGGGTVRLEKSADNGVTWGTFVGAAVQYAGLANVTVGDATTGETLTVKLANPAPTANETQAITVNVPAAANLPQVVSSVDNVGAGLVGGRYTVNFDANTKKIQLKDAVTGNDIGNAVDVTGKAGSQVTLGDVNTARTVDVTLLGASLPTTSVTDTITLGSSVGMVKTDNVGLLANTQGVQSVGSKLASGDYRVAYDSVAGTLQLQDFSGQAIGGFQTGVTLGSTYTVGDKVTGRTVTVKTTAGAASGFALVTVTNNNQSAEAAAFSGGSKFDNARAYAGLNVSSVDGAQAAIATIDAAVAKVSYQRSQMGAIQNRLDHTVNNLQVVSENLTASESRIRDVDMAMEMTQFTKHQILMQSGTAMLAQANQKNQAVLSLLR